MPFPASPFARESHRLRREGRAAAALGHPLAARAYALAAQAVVRRQQAALRAHRDERDRLVEEHMPRVVGLARRFRDHRVDLGDLVQAGSLALLEAAERYDRCRAVPFWSYAAPWVHGAIYRTAQDQRSAMRLPAAARSELGRLLRAQHQQAATGDARGPAWRAGIPQRRADVLLGAARPALSLQEPLGAGDPGKVLGDVIPDPSGGDPLDHVVAAADIEEAIRLLDTLGERQRDVLQRRFGLGRPVESLAEIGRRLGVTRERARQIEVAALERLRGAAADRGALL